MPAKPLTEAIVKVLAGVVLFVVGALGFPNEQIATTGMALIAVGAIEVAFRA